MYYVGWVLSLFTLLHNCPFANSQSCEKVDSCTCDMSNGKGQINLHSLAADSIDEPAFAILQNDFDGWIYKYNPCIGFNFVSYSDLALMQTNVGSTTQDLGVQSKVIFNYAESTGVTLRYESGDSVRTSRVLLICDSSYNSHRFRYVGELSSLEYDFELTTPCACPGLCDDNGPISSLPDLPTTIAPSTKPACNRIDSCTCEMSDGSGIVNLKGVSLYGVNNYEAEYSASDGTYWYKFNPCFGFSTRDDSLSDLAVLQSTDSSGQYGTDIGTQTSARFEFDTGTGLEILYTSGDKIRKSRVLLNCISINTHTFHVFGLLDTYEYAFSFSSPCACPGACDDHGVIGGPELITCHYVDSCTCDMSDGTGRINLHSLAVSAEPGQELTQSAFGAYGEHGYNYRYNPCNGFSMYSYSDLALVQTTRSGDQAYDVGVQNSTRFHYSESSGVTIQYRSSSPKRTGRVLLVCQMNLNSNTFEFVGELTSYEYDFILSSPCACPGMCDDNGPTVLLPTPPPSSGEDLTCQTVDSCTCIMSDGSGPINLHGLAYEGVITTGAFRLQGDDGFIYTYNPCNGFISGGFTDLAVYQSDSTGYNGYDLGIQTGYNIEYSQGSGVGIRYTAKDGSKKSRVLLICSPDTTSHVFEFVGESVDTEYEFILTTPCACPGACNSDGIIGELPATPPTSTKSCTKLNSCACEMSDGSGKINLQSLSTEANSGQTLTEASFAVLGDDGYNYKYNPCNGFSVFSFSDLALVQLSSNGNAAYDVGVQSSAEFSYSDASGVSIKYVSSPSSSPTRTGRVLLICQMNVNSNTFEFIGELTSLEYDFILSSPCACPGMCDDNGPTVNLPTPPPSTGEDLTCRTIDTCTCAMSDGSGPINLHSLALEGTILTNGAFKVQDSDGWYYSYNPCNGFRSGRYTDLAVYQSDLDNTIGYDLGIQLNSVMEYSQGSGLTIHYTANDALRKSRVLLICSPGTTNHVFEYVGETVATEYEFILTSPCACPGTCNNYGVINQPPVTPTPIALGCNAVDSCTCDMSDGTGRIDLHSLALSAQQGQTLTEAAFVITGSDGWIYKYNPCNGYSAFSYTDLALLQTASDVGYDVGVQSTAKFEYVPSSGLSLSYESYTPLRKGRVLLICEPNINAHAFEFVGELSSLEYDFILTTPCACPGLCDSNGLTSPLPTPAPSVIPDVTCEYIDACTCEMSDGSGQVNLHGPALDDLYLYNGGFSVYGDGWYFVYNPCNGFYAAGYSNLAIFQSQEPDPSYATWGYDLGVQTSANFNYTHDSGLTIQYTASDNLRNSRVLLICSAGTVDHKFDYVGELVSGEYDFVFTSPCACPGACDDNGVISGSATYPPSGNTCTYIDSCTCSMSDGSGTVNLHSLALEGTVLYDAAFSIVPDDGWNYKYNPCNGFTFQGYSDLAIAQLVQSGSLGYDLGVQSKAEFIYQDIADGQYSLSIRYTASDSIRSSKVLLVCESQVNVKTFEFVGELVVLEYDFILTSPCACPGLCDDNGPIDALPTPAPTPNTGVECKYIDSCTCEMSDGSGRVNLHGPALDGSYLYDSAFTTYGYDGWYYKYNPCDGFYLGGYSDLAVYQSSDYYGYGYFGKDLGIQSSARFDYSTSSGLTISYTADDSLRSSRVLLSCSPGSTYSSFEFIGELTNGEFDFLFTSPCACPGACDYNGVIQGPATPPPGSDVCTMVDSCTCDMSDGSGRINLHSLALEGETLDEAAFSIVGADTRQYKYNPCNGFSSSFFDDLAILQQDSFSASFYDLGVQSSAAFGYTQSSGVAIYYKAYDGVRKSRVLLICEQNLNVNTFQYVGELTVLEYDFILTSTCACPGYCDDNGPVVTLPTPGPSSGVDAACVFIDSCSCQMSDGSGMINLRSTALEGTSLYDSAFTIYGDDGWYYKYNPCNGFYSGGYYDLAVYQSSDKYGTYGYDLGVQTSTYFNYTSSNGLIIHYTAADTLRSSRVLLVCSPETTEHKLEFIGELISTEFDFVFTSPCACPGGCNDNGAIGATEPPGADVCQYVDSCTCEMADGSGKVNLHSLALEPKLGYLAESSFSVIGSDGWTYKYNPCNGFTFYIYSDLAIAQTDSYGYSGFDLGVQAKASFSYVESKGLSILYTSGEGLRKSRVLLVCQAEVNSNSFEFVGELITAEYDFILSSPCACPGICDEDGPIDTLPTLPPGGTEDKTCNFVDSCTCEMSDSSGTINLKSLSLGDYYYYDSAFTEYGDDGWYYKYNPCVGFYFLGEYDTAVAQSSDTYGYGYGNVLGVQSSAQFHYNESDGVTIRYTSYYQMSSRVFLVCEPDTNSHKFSIIGQAVDLEYQFMLTSPCACPGGCDDDGVTQPESSTYCTKLDSCACDMSDGTGRVNLRSIGLQGESLSDAAFTADGLDGWLYKYNPCTPFNLLYYDDLALAQVNAFGTSGHDLGVQKSSDFRYSSTTGLSIHYTSYDSFRSSKVLLVCDPYAMKAEFEFIGELITLEYDFLLKSVCACPGGCTDFGPVNPIITQAPQGQGVGDLPDTVHIYVNSSRDQDPSSLFWPDVGGSSIALIFHDIFLILLIIALIYLFKNVMFCRTQANRVKEQFNKKTDLKGFDGGEANA